MLDGAEGGRTTQSGWIVRATSLYWPFSRYVAHGKMESSLQRRGRVQGCVLLIGTMHRTGCYPKGVCGLKPPVPHCAQIAQEREANSRDIAAQLHVSEPETPTLLGRWRTDRRCDIIHKKGNPCLLNPSNGEWGVNPLRIIEKKQSICPHPQGSAIVRQCCCG